MGPKVHTVLGLCYINLFILTLPLVSNVTGEIQDTSVVHCDLKWVPVSKGFTTFNDFTDLSVRNKLLKINYKLEFGKTAFSDLVIVKSKLHNRNVIGLYNVTDETTNFSKFNQNFNPGKFEALFNPNNCSVVWVSVHDAHENQENLVKCKNEGNVSLMGRQLIKQKQGVEWQLGILKTQKNKLPTWSTLTSANKAIPDLDKVQILTSFRAEKATDFEIEIENYSETNLEDEIGIKSVVYPGTDVVRNKANITVVHTLAHRYSSHKSVANIKTTFNTDESITTRPNTKFGETNSTTYDVKNETSIIYSARRITVPPETSVMVCSRVNIKNPVINFQGTKRKRSKSGMLPANITPWSAEIMTEPRTQATHVLLPSNGRKRCNTWFLQWPKPILVNLDVKMDNNTFVTREEMEAYIGSSFME